MRKFKQNDRVKINAPDGSYWHNYNGAVGVVLEGQYNDRDVPLYVLKMYQVVMGSAVALVREDYLEETSVIASRVKTQGEPTLGKAIMRVAREIATNKDYRRSWRDNISMAFQDEYGRDSKLSDGEKAQIKEVADRAAKTSLNRFVKDVK